MPKLDADARLRAALHKLTARSLQSETNDAVIVVRLSVKEKASMQATARSLGLTMSEYVRRLHAVAVKRLAVLPKVK